MFLIDTKLFTSLYLLLLSSQCKGAKLAAGQCPNRGDPTIVECCLNYIDIGGECVACQPGTMGVNCSRRCPDGFYGQFCVNPCNCAPSQRCSKAFGCVCKGTDCIKENETSSETTTSSCRVQEAAVIAQGAVIGILVVCFVPLCVRLYRQQMKRVTKKPLNYIDTEVKVDQFEMESYEALQRNSLIQRDKEIGHRKESVNVKSRLQTEPRSTMVSFSASRGRTMQTGNKRTINLQNQNENYLDPITPNQQNENYVEPTLPTAPTKQRGNYLNPLPPSPQNENYLEPTKQTETYLDPQLPSTQNENYLEPTKQKETYLDRQLSSTHSEYYVEPTKQNENYLDPTIQTENENYLEPTMRTTQQEII